MTKCIIFATSEGQFGHITSLNIGSHEASSRVRNRRDMQIVNPRDLSMGFKNEGGDMSKLAGGLLRNAS